MHLKEFLKKHRIKTGELIEIETGKEKFEGYILPTESESIIKLNSKNIFTLNYLEYKY